MGVAVNTVGAPLMEIVAGAELNAPATLLARITIPLKMPPTLGVPKICPFALFSASPGGSVPATRLYVGAGEPLAA